MNKRKFYFLGCFLIAGVLLLTLTWCLRPVAAQTPTPTAHATFKTTGLDAFTMTSSISYTTSLKPTYYTWKGGFDLWGSITSTSEMSLCIEYFSVGAIELAGGGTPNFAINLDADHLYLVEGVYDAVGSGVGWQGDVYTFTGEINDWTQNHVLCQEGGALACAWDFYARIYVKPYPYWDAHHLNINYGTTNRNSDANWITMTHHWEYCDAPPPPIPIVISEPVWEGSTVVEGQAETGQLVTLQVIQTGYQESCKAVGPGDHFEFTGVPSLTAGHTVVVVGCGEYSEEYDSALVQALPSPYCLDGIELLTEPVTLTLSASWQSTATTTSYDYLAVRYRLENQSPGSANIYGVATVNGSGYSVNGGNVAVYTTTVPGGSTGLAGPDIEAAFKNTGDPVTLASACVINRPPPRPRYCTYFYDFENDLEGWLFAPGVGGNHDPAESNGAARILGDGELDAVMLSPLFESGLWEISAGVRSYSDGNNSIVTLGLVGAEWPYVDTDQSFLVGNDYETIQTSGLISGYAEIASQHTYVDWVCLNNINAGIPIGDIIYPFLPIPDCGGQPTFDDHPDFSITEIGNWIHWLAQKLGEVLSWLVCILTVIFNTAINWLLTQLVRLIELLPQVPENLFDLTGWIEWYRQLFILTIAWVVRQIINFYTSISNIIDWIVTEIVAPVMEWFRLLFVEVAAWIIGHVLAVISVVTGVDLLQIWSDARIFMQALGNELSLEFNSFLLLFNSTYDVLSVLITGWRGSLAGDTQADFGQGLGGFAAYLWVGVEWVNDAIEGTPLTALNFVAMGIIAWGLVQFTLGRARSWMEKIARL